MRGLCLVYVLPQVSTLASAGLTYPFFVQLFWRGIGRVKYQKKKAILGEFGSYHKHFPNIAFYQ